MRRESLQSKNLMVQPSTANEKERGSKIEQPPNQRLQSMQDQGKQRTPLGSPSPSQAMQQQQMPEQQQPTQQQEEEEEKPAHQQQQLQPSQKQNLMLPQQPAQPQQSQPQPQGTATNQQQTRPARNEALERLLGHGGSRNNETEFVKNLRATENSTKASKNVDPSHPTLGETNKIPMKGGSFVALASGDNEETPEGDSPFYCQECAEMCSRCNKPILRPHQYFASVDFNHEEEQHNPSSSIALPLPQIPCQIVANIEADPWKCGAFKEGQHHGRRQQAQCRYMYPQSGMDFTPFPHSAAINPAPACSDSQVPILVDHEESQCPCRPRDLHVSATDYAKSHSHCLRSHSFSSESWCMVAMVLSLAMCLLMLAKPEVFDTHLKDLQQKVSRLTG